MATISSSSWEEENRDSVKNGDKDRHISEKPEVSITENNAGVSSHAGSHSFDATMDDVQSTETRDQNTFNVFVKYADTTFNLSTTHKDEVVQMTEENNTIVLTTESGAVYRLALESGLSDEEYRVVANIIGTANGTMPIVFNKAIERMVVESSVAEASPGQFENENEKFEIDKSGKTRNSKADAIPITLPGQYKNTPRIVEQEILKPGISAAQIPRTTTEDDKFKNLINEDKLRKQNVNSENSEHRFDSANEKQTTEELLARFSQIMNTFEKTLNERESSNKQLVKMMCEVMEASQSNNKRFAQFSFDQMKKNQQLMENFANSTVATAERIEESFNKMLNHQENLFLNWTQQDHNSFEDPETEIQTERSISETDQNSVKSQGKSENNMNRERPSLFSSTRLIEKQKQDEITLAVRRELDRLGVSDMNINSTSQVSDKIRVEIQGRENNIRREYKLTSKTRFDYFFDYLTSELRALDLLYVIDSKVIPNNPPDEDTKKRNDHRVRDIIINRIDPQYYTKTIHLKNPLELLNKLREIKKLEMNLTPTVLRQELHNIRYDPKKETASEYWDRFEELVRAYDNLSKRPPLSEDDKRDFFYDSIQLAVPQVQSLDFLHRSNVDGTGMSYERLKTFILEHEAAKRGTIAKTTALHTARQTNRDGKKFEICIQCGSNDHSRDKCPHRDSGLKLCYECKKFVNHIGKNCPDRLAKSGGRGQGQTNSRNDNQKANRNSSKQQWFSKRRNYDSNKTSDAKRRKMSEDKNKENDSGIRKERRFFGGDKNTGEMSVTNHDIFSLSASHSSDFIEKLDYSNTSVARFVADTGATEHLANSKIYFKTYNNKNMGVIRCANRDSAANLETEGVGDISGNNDGKRVQLQNVICSEDLAENLLSLRKFVDMGFCIYLDNERIDIVEPNSNKSIISGVYQQPYWLVDFEIDNKFDSKKVDRVEIGNQIIACLTSNSNSVVPRYMTRKIAAQTKQNEPDSPTIDKENSNDGVSKRETETEGNPNEEDLEISGIQNFESTICDRKISEISDSILEDVPESQNTSLEKYEKFKRNNGALLWHCRLGHASLSYLKEFQKRFPENKQLREAVFDDSIRDCEVCLVSKTTRLPFVSTRTRATQPLQIIHSDLMGPISPKSHPKGYRFIAIFMDDYSRLSMAYPMKAKSDTGQCLEVFVKSSRNILGHDAKVCYFRSDQGTEFTGGDTVEVLNRLGAELQLACPDTPEHNGGSERFNRTIQEKVRSLMYDSGLPENMWDLALGAAVYIYNRTPHKSNDMIAPLAKFAPNYSFDINQVKRFGSVAFIKVQRKIGPKFRCIGRRVILIGYTRTGYIFLKPEEGKYYESRDARFNEKTVYRDIYSKNSIQNWKSVSESIDKNKWLIEFEKKSTTDSDVGKTEGVKRKRGRPRKHPALDTLISAPICDSSFADIRLDTEVSLNSQFADNNQDGKLFKIDEEIIRTQHKNIDANFAFSEEVHYAFLAKINRDPASYKEAMSAADKDLWNKAILDELTSMNKNQVWTLVNRPSKSADGKTPNIIDSRWVLKRKVNQDGISKCKARLVIRGFKDRNVYDLSETYAPVSRLALVRVVLAIINKFDLETCQLDVKTAFLNGNITEEIYMEIPDGTDYSNEIRKTKVCKLNRSLYGLKISPKRWNERFTEAALKIGLTLHTAEPCLFTWRSGDMFLILLLYVDDMLVASNDTQKLAEVKNELMNEFEMTDLGEVKSFLSIEINRNRKRKLMTLSQTNYIDKILERFGFKDCYPQRSPMITNQVAFRQLRAREESSDESILDSTRSPMNVPYREAVGSLLYLANTTRPDIAYSVNVLSRHQINPTEEDWKSVKRVFRYLKGTRDQSLNFRAELDTLEAYSDASFADCKGSLTTSGYVIRLFGDSVAWRTHKQSYVALSTCQAEFVAMSEACQELVALSNSIKLILTNSLNPARLWCDNQAAISATKTGGGSKLRHMTEVREFYVKECVNRFLVEISWIRSKSQLADIFTKPLSFQLHRNFVDLVLNNLKE